METTMIDMEQMADDAAPAEGTAAGLNDLGLLALEIEGRIKDLNDALSAEKKDLDKVMMRLIPEMMNELAIDEYGFDTPDGGRARLTLGTKVVGSLRNAPDEGAAVRYLEETAFEGGVKTVVSVDFTEAERDAASALMADVIELSGKHPTMGRSIAPSTLAAFGRTKLAEDSTWNFEMVGLKAFATSKFTKRS